MTITISNHGGSRPGAGRPKKGQAKKPAIPAATASLVVTVPVVPLSPLDFLLNVVNDPNADPRMRVRAAGVAAQYVHVRRHDGGQRDEKDAAAKRVAAKGKFAQTAPPRLLQFKPKDTP